MILVFYDISNIKTQGRVRKYLKKYGRAIQYSVYEIHHTTTMLRTITSELTQMAKKYLKIGDSIIIVPITESQLNKCVVLGDNGFDIQTFLEI
jgi:CRISPR-associated endonuclease Cas2